MMRESPEGWLLTVQRAALVAALWLASAALSRTLAHTVTQTIPVWLSSGVTFAALLVAATWRWPALLAGAGAAALAWALAAHDLTVGTAVAYSVVEVASMAAGALVVARARQSPASPSGMLALLGGALLASLLAATLACAVWAAHNPQADLVLEWRVGFLSTLVGLLLIAPLVQAYQGFRVRRSGGLPMMPFLGGAAAFAVFVIAVLAVFSPDAQQRWGAVAPTLAYLPMPFLLAANLLWGPRGGTVATLLGALLMIQRTAAGGGPFALHEGFAGESVIEVQGFITAWAVVLLLTSALAEGRRSALRRAHDWQLRYERTLRAVGVASVEYDAVTGATTWGEGAAEVLGADAAAAESVDAWLALIDPAERALVQGAWQAISAGQRAASEQAYTLQLPGGRTRRVRERLAVIRGGDDRVERIVGLLDVVAPEHAHG